ncbi:hypothetical protein KY360_02680 [Candidatus Woesearchaeota archaeon]|nr:hypothetical protein [Candidatus Woesearchaeota archaeon]
MKKTTETKLIQDIDELEKQRKARMINIAIVVVLLLAFLFLAGPDLSQFISIEDVRSNIKELIPERKKEEPKFEPVVEEIEEVEAEPEPPKPGTVLEIGIVTQFRGKDVILSHVSPKKTYCSFRVDGESILITKGKSRSIQGITIEVLEPSLSPDETCRVMLR